MNLLNIKFHLNLTFRSFYDFNSLIVSNDFLRNSASSCKSKIFESKAFKSYKSEAYDTQYYLFLLN